MTWPPNHDSSLLLASLISLAALYVAVKTRTPPSRCCGCPVFLSLRRFHDCREIFVGRLGVAAMYRVAGMYYVVVHTWKQTSRAFLTHGFSGWFSSLNETTTHVRPVTNPVHNTRFLQRTILSVHFRSLQTECGEPNCRSVTTQEAMCKFQM
jgi:hypothetical protein